MQANSVVGEKDTLMLKQLVTNLLREKPADPVPFIYNFLAQIQAGVEQPTPITNHEVSLIKNLRLKIDDLKTRLGEAEQSEHSEQSEEEEEDDEELQKKLASRQNKGGRKGVSAEVFGEHNKKEDFQPKVIEKSNETKDKLRKRLLQAFMFNALDPQELSIVIDAIEEAQYKGEETIIQEGDSGDCMYVLESGSLKCTKVFPGNTEPTHLKTYVPGEGFGELALLYNCPRAATITALENSVVWRLDRDTFNHIVKDAA